jgi:hypothetical protein
MSRGGLKGSFPPTEEQEIMKTKHLTTMLGILLPALGVAQQYSIDRSTIDGGGGTSTGGRYTLTGTIGQPDAGTMSGGIYTLSGGFWGALAAVQTPGAPDLWVTLTPTNSALIWWDVSPTSWRLQTTTNLVSTDTVWTDCSYRTNGATCYRLESPPSGNRFYRLLWP